MSECEPFNLDVVRSLAMSDAFTHDLRFFPEVDSTNRVASHLPHGAWTTGTAIFTDHQTSGRGRSGRTWHDPPATSVLASVLLEPLVAVQPAEYVMLASLAVSDAVRSSASLETAIKWPNDIHVGGKKVAGILSEFSGSGHDARVILGVGINVNTPVAFLESFDQNASSLSHLTHRPLSRESVAAALLGSLAHWYHALKNDRNTVFSSWKSRLDTIGAVIDAREPSGISTVRAVNVQHDGGLVVQDASLRTRVIYAADVSIRSRPGLQQPE
jgi:BirA family transcriptional regulator, biotin operon repressor / biotin---[acetyl-CoA-carboxylase] ligase